MKPHAKVPIPTRMRHLPIDGRGYPIPANIYRDLSGTPHFTINDEPTRLRQIAEDRCPICDTKLLRGRWFVGGPLSALHEAGVYIDLPMHGECARYALQVCPYLAMPSYTKRIDAATLRKVDPSSRDEVVFQDPSMIPTKPVLFVCAMTTGYQTDGHTVRPHRPWSRIEFWKDGICLPFDEGMARARAIVDAQMPPLQKPRLIHVPI